MTDAYGDEIISAAEDECVGGADLSSIAGPTHRLVIKVGGNVITPRGRNPAVDHDALDALASVAEAAASVGIQLTVLPGGVGGGIFLPWVRRNGSSSALVSEVGCALVDIGATIVADYLYRQLRGTDVRCAPRKAESLDQFMEFADRFDIVVAGSRMSGAISSDSLALLLGEEVSAPILLVKQLLPVVSSAVKSGPDEPQWTHWISYDRLAQAVETAGPEPRAGEFSFVDTWALTLMRRSEFAVSLTTSAALKGFKESGLFSPVLGVKTDR